MSNKQAQRQALVSIEGVPGLWATKSGGNMSADASDVWDGGALAPEKLPGPASAENVSVSRPFDRLRDLPRIAALRRGVGNLRATVTVQPTDENLFPIGTPTVYPAALLVTLEEPEYDASSSDAQTITLEFAVSTVV